MSKLKENQYLKEAQAALNKAAFEKYKDIFNKFLFGKELKLESWDLLPQYINMCILNMDKDDNSEVNEDIESTRVDNIKTNNWRIISDIRVYGAEQQRKVIYLHATYDNHIANDFYHILVFYVRSLDFDAKNTKICVDGIQSLSDPRLFIGTLYSK